MISGHLVDVLSFLACRKGQRHQAPGGQAAGLVLPGPLRCCSAALGPQAPPSPRDSLPQLPRPTSITDARLIPVAGGVAAKPIKRACGSRLAQVPRGATEEVALDPAKGRRGRRSHVSAAALAGCPSCFHARFRKLDAARQPRDSPCPRSLAPTAALAVNGPHPRAGMPGPPMSELEFDCDKHAARSPLTDMMAAAEREPAPEEEVSRVAVLSTAAPF